MNDNRIRDFNQQQYPKVNREFKSDLFCMVFQSKKDALSLYNAVNGSNYQDEDALEFNTLEDAIYLSVKNDISFLIGGTMNLYEHQSTYNPNMPMRGFLYLARLSDAFASAPLSPNKREEMSAPCLECITVMLNINYGHNKELMQKCRKLKEYAIFVSTVRDSIASGDNLPASVSQVVDDCIARGILKDILLKNKSEVMSMVLTTFDREKYEKAMQEEWKEMGQARINRLNLLLAEQNRTEDIVKAAADPEYQEQLFREFDI